MEFNAISLGLSLDMLIYIIRYGKTEADDCRFNRKHPWKSTLVI